MATTIDDNAVDEKSGKSIWWLLNIRCTSIMNKNYKGRNKMGEELEEVVENKSLNQESLEETARLLWQSIKQYEGMEFQTVKGLAFTYTIKGNEMFIDRKEKSITRSSVILAFQNLVRQGGIVSGPKKLGTFGASYLYPVFMKLELIIK